MKKNLLYLTMIVSLLCSFSIKLSAQETQTTPVKILVLCTGNSCRSQMAHGFLQAMDPTLYVRSAGVKPAARVNPKAVQVMKEVGIDISDHTPHNVTEYMDEPWDFVITVCDNANKTCPVFNGKVKARMHIGFDDPSEATGSDEYIMSEFRRVRDLIKARFTQFYNEQVKFQNVEKVVE